MPIDRTGWSGEGSFTEASLEALAAVDGIEVVRVEDAPASRADAGFSLVSNEIYVRAAARTRREPRRVLGMTLGRRRVVEPGLTLEALAQLLAASAAIGEADYVDDTMIQYLRTERIVPPYQTRGYKLVEMVRVYLIPVPRQG